MVKIRKNIVSKSIADSVTYNGTNTKTYLIIHETDNTNKGADADAHGRLQANGNSRSASWHYSVDDKEAVQSFSDSTQCWAAGNAHYNKHGIQIETCVNSDGDYKKAVSNTAELAKEIMAKHGIPLKHVLQHHDASLKNCPRNLRSGAKGVTWAQFKAMLTGSTAAVEDKPDAPSESAANPSGSLGLVDWMKSKGMNSSFNNRKKLAGQYGISNYSGTAAQNTKLLAKLQAGEPKQPTASKTTAKGNMTTDSIVTYLNSINADSSYSNRAKLAKKYGIGGYKGTAAQNTKLLGILRGGSAPAATKKKGNQTTSSIVDYLKSINVNSGYTNRKKLAAKHGIKNYSGTAAQNAQLLKKMRG